MNPVKPTGIFTLPNIFVGALVGMILILLLSNTNVFLAKMGFETKTTLKASLVKSEMQLEELAKVNQKNAEELKLERKRTEQLTKALTELTEAKKKAEVTVLKMRTAKVNKSRPIIERLEARKVVTETHITVHREDADALSLVQIEHLHEVYNKLFPRT